MSLISQKDRKVYKLNEKYGEVCTLHYFALPNISYFFPNSVSRKGWVYMTLDDRKGARNENVIFGKQAVRVGVYN